MRSFAGWLQDAICWKSTVWKDLKGERALLDFIWQISLVSFLKIEHNCAINVEGGSDLQTFPKRYWRVREVGSDIDWCRAGCFLSTTPRFTAIGSPLCNTSQYHRAVTIASPPGEPGF
jgi:hypothetical protein